MDTLEDRFWKKPTSIRTLYNMRALGYVNVICVTIIIITNIFMILVFTRKNMISPINTIIAHYIGAVTLTVVSYIPHTYHEFLRAEKCSIAERKTYMWETISYHGLCFGFLFRHITVWMAMMLAVWRYIAVIYPLKERQYCDITTTNRLIYAGYIVVIVITIPPYFATGVGPAVKLLDENGCPSTNYTTGKNVTIYEFQAPLEDYIFWYSFELYAYAVFLKLLPSVVLAFISIKLVINLLKVGKQHTRMVATSNPRNTCDSKKQQQIRQKTDRTSIILVVILVLFVVGEVPHGTFGFLTAWYGPKFFWKYYYYGVEICNTGIHVTETFNFLIYYSMSHQFRSTFKTLFINNFNLCKIVTPQKSSSSLPGEDKLQDNSTRSSSVFTINSSCM